MTNETDTYQAYLLRFRRSSVSTPWRMSAQSVEDEETYHFATLEALVAFLQTQLDLDSDWEIRVDPKKPNT